MKVLVLAGGKGTRLWPMSRDSYPKQFLPFNGVSLFRQTVDRCLLLERPQNIYVSTNEAYYRFVRNELKGTKVPKRNIITEPAAKNTGAAILYALKSMRSCLPGEQVMVCPSDHFISPHKHFARTVEKAKRVASDSLIVTFGIRPTGPETGYGYIGSKPCRKGGVSYNKVEHFVEKPKLPLAKKLLSRGNYYWNAGIFLFPMELMMKEFEQHAPDLISNLHDFSSMPSVPIDEAVIERSHRVAMVPANFTWSDIGSWSSFHEVQTKDSSGNVVMGSALVSDVKNSLIVGSKRLVVCIGIQDTAVIETEDAVFVAPKKRSQEVKAMVEELKRLGHST